MRRLRRVSPIKNPNEARKNHRRFKVIDLFVTLIVAFITPYIAWLCYSSGAMVLKFKPSYKTDYIVRMINASLVFINTVVGSTIMFVKQPFLKKKILQMFQKISQIVLQSASDKQ